MVDHYNPPNRMFKRASIIPDSDITILFSCDDEIHLNFKSETGDNLVSVNENGFWYCTCENFQYSHSGLGEYCCKHIIRAIIYIAENKGKLDI